MSQLALEWHTNPDAPREGVAKGALAWCACGWRAFVPTSTGEDGTGKRVNETAAATEMRHHHRLTCPLRPVVDVAPSGVLA
jgi:hypothetical protein